MIRILGVAAVLATGACVSYQDRLDRTLNQAAKCQSLPPSIEQIHKLTPDQLVGLYRRGQQAEERLARSAASRGQANLDNADPCDRAWAIHTGLIREIAQNKLRLAPD